MSSFTDGQTRLALSPRSAFDALALAAIRRVDVVQIGDSNQIKDGYGWSGGFTKALTARFGMYATPVYAANPSYFGGSGGTASSGQGASGGATTGASTAHAALALPPLPSSTGAAGANAGNTYSYLTTGTATSQSALIADPSGIDVTARLRCWFNYGTFSTGSGSFKFDLRDEQNFGAISSDAALINTNTGVDGSALGSIKIAADPTRSHSIGFKWAKPGSTAITGPWIGFWSRAENMDKETGVSVHTLYGVGGQSLYDMAYQFTTLWTTQHLTNYFTEVRRLQLIQGLKPIVVVMVNSGLNDQNETLQPSLGFRASTTPASATAYRDNLEALIARIEAVWTANGWDLAELFWLVMPSHPINTDTVIASYRAQARDWAARRLLDRRMARVTAFDLTTVTSFAELLALSYFQAGNTDYNHLVAPTAYDDLASRTVAKIPTISLI